MDRKGRITTAEPLEYADFIHLLSGLHQDRQYRWELYCCVSFSTACRISDVRTLCWKDILDKDELIKIEQKTGKTREIPLGRGIQNRLTILYKLLGSPDKDLPVISNPHTGKPFTREYINRKLKVFKDRYHLPIKRISTHTFRKTFGRYVYDAMGRTTEAITLLCLIFKHANIQTTMIYLGIKQDEIDQVFHTIDLSY